MASSDTMELMGESFVSLAEKLPIERISVSDIVAASGKNRKTFYYHFEDKAHLIRWVFRNDLAETLLERFDSDHLVYEREEDGAIADKRITPLRRSACAHSMDLNSSKRSPTRSKSAAHITQALHSTEKDGLRSYLYKLYVPALERDIRFILSNRSLSDSAVHFLAEFYTGAAISYLVHRISDPELLNAGILSDVEPFQNIIHSSLESEIKEQQLRRVL